MRVCVLRGVGESGLAEVVSRQLFFVFFYVKLVCSSVFSVVSYSLSLIFSQIRLFIIRAGLSGSVAYEPMMIK